MTVHYSYPGGKDLSGVCINSKWTIGISTLFQCVLWDSKGSQVFICGYNFPNKLVGRQIFHNTEVVRDRTTVAKLGEFRTVVVYICYQYCQVAFLIGEVVTRCPWQRAGACTRIWFPDRRRHAEPWCGRWTRWFWSRPCFRRSCVLGHRWSRTSRCRRPDQWRWHWLPRLQRTGSETGLNVLFIWFYVLCIKSISWLRRGSGRTQIKRISSAVSTPTLTRKLSSPQSNVQKLNCVYQANSS